MIQILQDLDAVEALIQGLALFQGGVLMVFLNSLLSLHFLSKMDIDSSTWMYIETLEELCADKISKHTISFWDHHPTQSTCL